MGTRHSRPKALESQVMVIVGASSGIGLATAMAAARSGTKLVLAARNRVELERIAADIRGSGGDAIAVAADVTVPAEAHAVVGGAIERYGRIDTVVNTVGVTVYGTCEQTSIDDLRRMLEVHVIGQATVAQAALPYLEQTGGALVCVASGFSDRAVPLQGAYCAAKSALAAWLESLRTELMHRRSRVRVTIIKPASIGTPLFDKAKTYLGVQPRPIPPVYAPELAARAILHAACSNVRELYVGGAAKALSLAQRLSPKLLDVPLSAWAGALQRTRRPRSLDAPNNLFHPLEHDGGVHGATVGPGRDRSAYHVVAVHSVAASFVAAAALGVASLMLSRRASRPCIGSAAGVAGLAGLGFAGKAVLAALFVR